MGQEIKQKDEQAQQPSMSGLLLKSLHPVGITNDADR